ncbi:hypothetical protein CDL15_Pgr023410 [Punica granatum]|uniref:Uncharacterized protein n=1 Tax=Punica granatum TaxID=22663 RepID=A0A218Y189_PUNGR|nr:hypothetical protein CDL15_Pgr023410 [Punica granatum]
MDFRDIAELYLPMLHMLCRNRKRGDEPCEASHQSAWMVHRSDTVLTYLSP